MRETHLSLWQTCRRERTSWSFLCQKRGTFLEAQQHQYSRGTGAEFYQSFLNFGTMCLTPTDGNSPDGITLVPWDEKKQLVWTFTCVDLLAPSRIENVSVANTGTAAEDGEELRTFKYVCLTDKV